jgi:hypothetical protein
MSETRPAVPAAVVMEREAQPNRWEDWRFRVVEVVVDDGGFGEASRVLRDDGRVRRTLHPGFAVELFPDEAEGYYLNLATESPVWFVLWRIDDEQPGEAAPAAVSLSYNEAGRWLDAQERVDNVPLDAPVRAWLQAYTDVHYRPEPKRRKRPASFLPPKQRE